MLYDKYSVHNHDTFDHDHEQFFDELTKIKIVEYVLSITQFVDENEGERGNKGKREERERERERARQRARTIESVPTGLQR